MPSTVTHSYFAMDVYDKMPIRAKEIIQYDKDDLKVFGQSMDALFFYSIFTPYKGKRIRLFNSYFQDNKTQEFFINLIEYIKYNNLEKDSKVMVFLYGLICHYISDSIIHPYVNYKSKKIKYEHNLIEHFLDCYLIEKRDHVKPWKYNMMSNSFNNVLFTNNLREVINCVYKETFDINNMTKFYEKSVKDMYWFFKLFRQDKTGIKIGIYNFLDFVTREKIFKLKLFSYHYKFKTNTFLNENHKTWSNPCDKKIKCTRSFDELYIYAVDEAIKVVKEVDKYLLDNKKVNLKKLFPNTSYSTGLNCNKKLEFKYFES